MKKKLIIFLLLLAVLCSSVFSQSSERRRGFYLDTGIGFGRVSYNNEVDEMLKQTKELGYDRMTLSIDFALGWAVLQNFYVVGSIAGFGDAFMKPDFSDHVQLNTYIYGAGVRFYPLPSMKHLQLGADLGIGRMVLVRSVPGLMTFGGSEWGFAAKLSVAFDFDRTMTGPALLLGGDVQVNRVEGDTIAGFSIFAKFVFK